MHRKFARTILISTIFFVALTVVFLFWIMRPSVSTSTLSPTQIPMMPIVPTELPVMFFCGQRCPSGLNIYFYGEEPREFIIKATGEDSDAVILHCFDTTARDGLQNSEFYLFDDPKVEELRKRTSALDLCPSNHGEIEVRPSENGEIESISVHCVNDPNAEIVEWVGAYCIQESKKGPSNGVNFSQFAPAETEITVFWDDKSKTVTEKPDYGEYDPADCNCSYQAAISINLQ